MTSPSRTDRTRVVVLGASGMLGSALVRHLAAAPGVDVLGTVRRAGRLPQSFRDHLAPHLLDGVDVLDPDSRRRIVAEADVVVNAVGVIKQASGLEDRVSTVEVNALLPHQLAEECLAAGARLVHVSTDCVFSGRRGLYTEADVPDPIDFYGRSKLLGEVEAPALTLRTSIVGHEVQRHASLVDWFLNQPPTSVRGFAGAVYSGVTTLELARLLVDVVVPTPTLQGLYHVASEPITKLDLLRLLARAYGWGGDIVPDKDFSCDRSMTADRLRDVTGYQPPSWSQMVDEMHRDRPVWAVGHDEGGTVE